VKLPCVFLEDYEYIHTQTLDQKELSVISLQQGRTFAASLVICQLQAHLAVEASTKCIYFEVPTSDCSYKECQILELTRFLTWSKVI